MQKPNNIDSIFLCFEKKYSKEFVSQFKDTPEQNIIGIYHSAFVSKFHDILEENSTANAIFESTEIYNTSDRAYVILLMWHRKLNGKPLGFEDLLKKVSEFYENIDECVKRKQKNAIDNFKKLSIGDTITLVIPVEIRGNHTKSTVLYDCPVYEWKSNGAQELIVKGILTKKIAVGYPEDLYIKLKIISLSNSDTKFFFEEIKPLDTIKINLNSYGMPI